MYCDSLDDKLAFTALFRANWLRIDRQDVELNFASHGSKIDSIHRQSLMALHHLVPLDKPVNFFHLLSFLKPFQFIPQPIWAIVLRVVST